MISSALFIVSLCGVLITLLSLRVIWRVALRRKPTNAPMHRGASSSVEVELQRLTTSYLALEKVLEAHSQRQEAFSKLIEILVPQIASRELYERDEARMLNEIESASNALSAVNIEWVENSSRFIGVPFSIDQLGGNNDTVAISRSVLARSSRSHGEPHHVYQ